MSEEARNTKSLQFKPIPLAEIHDLLMDSAAQVVKFSIKWTIDNWELSELRIRNYKYTRKLNLDPTYVNIQRLFWSGTSHHPKKITCRKIQQLKHIKTNVFRGSMPYFKQRFFINGLLSNNSQTLSNFELLQVEWRLVRRLKNIESFVIKQKRDALMIRYVWNLKSLNCLSDNIDVQSFMFKLLKRTFSLRNLSIKSDLLTINKFLESNRHLNTCLLDIQPQLTPELPTDVHFVEAQTQSLYLNQE